MWAVILTISDLSFAVYNLAKFCDDPGPVDGKAAMKTLQYLWRTKTMGITYDGVAACESTMSAYVDS